MCANPFIPKIWGQQLWVSANISLSLCDNAAVVALVFNFTTINKYSLQILMISMSSLVPLDVKSSAKQGVLDILSQGQSL